MIPTGRPGARLTAALLCIALTRSSSAGAQPARADTLRADGPPHAGHPASHPDGHPASHGGARLGADAIALAVRAAPAPQGRTRTEGYLAQPIVMGHAPLWGDRVRLTGTLNLEGLTLARGALTPGIYGEGFVDRRHPHTLVHEAMASVVGAPWGPALRLSAAGGKGFVPFGTDDPMVRPFALFPVNHHLAQVIERYVAIGGARARGLLLEGALFNGDEPTGPWAWPRASRFGEAWAARATAYPLELAPARRRDALPGTLELQGSLARVPSPEERTGVGLDQHKSSLSARWATADAVTPDVPGGYALVEWARTDERRGTRRAFRYQSVLAEGAAWRPLGGVALALAARAERTTRPEEERLADPFRTVRPHFEQNVLGLTEWRILTVSASAQPRAVRFRLAPFVEVARARPRALVLPSTFEPELFYRGREQWTLAVGMRLGLGMRHGRMGRYGVASAS